MKKTPVPFSVPGSAKPLGKKRYALKIIVFFLLGALVNTLIALSVALASRPPWAYVSELLPPTETWLGAPPEEWPSRPTLADHWEGVGLRRISIAARARTLDYIKQLEASVAASRRWFEQPSPDLESVDHQEAFQREADRQIWLDHVYELAILQPGIRGWYLEEIVFAGWPFESFRGVRWKSQRYGQATSTGAIRQKRIRGAIEVDFHPTKEGITGETEKRLIPLSPLWPGFAINTVLYGLVLWLLTIGPLTMRRFIRRTKGLCPKCGYNLRGDFSCGCPECGWARQPVSD